MKVTVDANILFSALLKAGLTWKLWFNPTLELYAPGFLVEEFQKHQAFLLKKFGGTAEEFGRLTELLFAQVKFVPEEELNAFMPAARSLLNDLKDLHYLACALKEDTVLWSNDQGFKQQHRTKTLTTTEMKEALGTL